MGRVLSEEENQEVSRFLGSGHVSKVNNIAVSLAQASSNDEPELVIVIGSCCGTDAFRMPLNTGAEIIEGLQGAIQFAANMKETN